VLNIAKRCASPATRASSEGSTKELCSSMLGADDGGGARAGPIAKYSSSRLIGNRGYIKPLCALLASSIALIKCLLLVHPRYLKTPPTNMDAHTDMPALPMPVTMGTSKQPQGMGQMCAFPLHFWLFDGIPDFIVDSQAVANPAPTKQQQQHCDNHHRASRLRGGGATRVCF
jgi:hypothetical protein